MNSLLGILSQAPWRRRPVLFFGVTLVLVRLWLTAGQTLTALGDAWHDDAHFLLLATDLVSGKWLGPYNQMTLIKGPFYSMWIAVAFAFEIPLLFAEHCLYVASCILFVWALTPELRSAGVRLALFAVLLLNPANLSENVMARLLRESIYSSLTLLVLGTALGLALRLHRPFRSTLPWVLGLGVSLAGYFLCREERIWLLPSLLVILLGALARRPAAWRAIVRLVGVALAVFMVLVGAVVLKNGFEYGAFVVTEFTEGPFMAAYGAAASVRHEINRPHVPIPTETRQRIYDVSPRFAELAPYLEGEDGRGWWANGCRAFGICDDLAAGWDMWALREAAAHAKHYTSGGEAVRYWSEVVVEIDRACADGRLACGPRGFGFLPPLRNVDVKAFGDTLVRAVVAVALFGEVGFQPSPSYGSAEQLDVFRDITSTRLTPDTNGVERKLRNQDGLRVRKETVLRWILFVYQTATPLFACAALLGLGVAVVVAISRQNVSGSLLAAGALLAGAVTRIALLALVQSTSFPSINAAYLTPTHLLLTGFAVLALHAAFAAIWRPRWLGKIGETETREDQPTGT